MSADEEGEQGDLLPAWPEPLAPSEVEEARVVDQEGQTLGSFREVAASYFRGPLPSPESLHEYNEVFPGLGDRIVTSWEEESRHRRSLERRALEAAVRTQSRGQLIAAVIALVVTAGGIVLIALGHSITGLVALIPSLVALVGVFIHGTRSGRGQDASE